MILEESEDFTVDYASGSKKHYMVNSVFPYIIDFPQEIKITSEERPDAANDNILLYYTIQRLLNENRISPWIPNATIECSLFEDEIIYKKRNYQLDLFRDEELSV